VRITAPTFTDVVIAAFRQEQREPARRGSRPPRSARKTCTGRGIRAVGIVLPVTAGNPWALRKEPTGPAFRRPAAEQDHMTQIGLAARRHDAIDVLPLLRIKIWQRNVQRGQHKDCLC
jgi:hypothetical protein